MDKIGGKLLGTIILLGLIIHIWAQIPSAGGGGGNSKSDPLDIILFQACDGNCDPSRLMFGILAPTSKLADTVEENICGAGNHEQFPVPFDSMTVLRDAAKTSPKSQVETTNKAEVLHLDADVTNVEICTLNQNPAEIIIDDGEIMDGLSYKHFPSAPKVL